MRLQDLLRVYDPRRQIDKYEVFRQLQLYGLDQLRQAVVNPNLDEAVINTHYRVMRGVALIASLKGLDAIVFNNGSTHPDRLTCVQDPASIGTRPFPPDVDINLVARGDIRPDIKDRICDFLKVEPFVRTDNFHNQEVLLWRESNVNASLSIRRLSKAEIQNGIYTADDRKFTPSERIEVRALKLILQRNGAYASYNRGINGLASEEIIRQCKIVEKAIEYLGNVAKQDHKSLPFRDVNLFSNVSHHVWKRIEHIAQVYKTHRGVRYHRIYSGDWEALNKDQINLFHMTPSGPVFDGMEGYYLAQLAKNALAASIPKGVSPHGFDFYLIPHQGLAKGEFRVYPLMFETDIFGSFPYKTGIDPNELKEKFKNYMHEHDFQTSRRLDK